MTKYRILNLIKQAASRAKSKEMIKTIPAIGKIDKRIEKLHFEQDNEGPLVFKFCDETNTKTKCAALIEIANTPALRTKGLSKRASLSKVGGMYFNKACTFWMKDTNFPLDLLFIDKSGRVTEKIAMAVDKEGRKLYPPRSEKSAHAIELPLGFCDKYGIKVGDVIKVSKLY
jgi:uncharacterized membrane protein (UPF0127 family)